MLVFLSFYSLSELQVSLNYFSAIIKISAILRNMIMIIPITKANNII